MNLEELKTRFASGNSVPVERAYLTKDEFDRLLRVVEALEFYSQDIRYEGANQRKDDGDKFTPDELPYRLDVTRDRGEIARAALRDLEQS